MRFSLLVNATYMYRGIAKARDDLLFHTFGWLTARQYALLASRGQRAARCCCRKPLQDQRGSGRRVRGGIGVWRRMI